ncbi:sulfite exporter TauE/SafE family protein [Flavilitoribacter nigricans]|uniref:Probable membrane transporter protein n=1 Tax=Flavilitoribacter nigricans (strain ATCC 23147 / DSM 23189 / NBRC 102662 / NCIMB 1420 / SS-2) TaxID=1122177 RepID=A0A2D0MZB0_FLAN2|nr:sulfite exporter TauE/SafE family protein [Flavilitoribacter nigricans]PHN01585.1 permease [Flavilitoribacter nigricans DSM 23189 = NBRC 102662]
MLGYIASFCVGLILGLIGGGGSILAIPILIYLFSVDVVQATAYSLFIVGVTSLMGSIQKYRESLVDLRVGLIFGVPSILAKFLSRKYVVPQIPEVIMDMGPIVLTKRMFILSLFCLMVILAASAMIANRAQPVSRWYEGKGGSALLGTLGGVIGLITGISGLGGGFIIVPTLLFFTRIPIKKAIGTALFIISVSSLIGFTGDLSHTQMAWPFLLGITGIAVLGIFTGNFFSKQLSNLQLKKTFGWFVLIMGVAILLKETCFIIHKIHA